MSSCSLWQGHNKPCAPLCPAACEIYKTENCPAPTSRQVRTILRFSFILAPTNNDVVVPIKMKFHHPLKFYFLSILMLLLGCRTEPTDNPPTTAPTADTSVQEPPVEELDKADLKKLARTIRPARQGYMAKARTGH